jgi:hypothetical protein
METFTLDLKKQQLSSVDFGENHTASSMMKTCGLQIERAIGKRRRIDVCTGNRHGRQDVRGVCNQAHIPDVTVAHIID